MLKISIARIAAIVAFISQAVAQVDCNANITIRVMSQLEEVRDNCEVIGGDLILGANISGHADLDGIRKVTGNLDLFSCNRLRGDNCTIESGATATVSSSSLEDIGGSLWMDTPLAIEKVLFPKLARVGNDIVLEDNGHLTELDISNVREARRLYLDDVSKLNTLNITNLASVRVISMWGAKELKRIISNGIQNLTHASEEGEEEDLGVSEYYINIADCEQLGDVGDLFAGSLVPRGGKPLRLELGEGQYEVLDLKDITIGWPNMTRMNIRGSSGRFRFGNDDTESMYVEEGYARASAGFERADNLQNLSFGYLEIIAEAGVDEDRETIQLPFDRVGELMVRVNVEANVAKMSLPERAQDWGLKNLTLLMPRTKFLTTDGDDEERTIWHWPKDLHDVRLEGLIEQDLLDLFIEGDRRVSGRFLVTSTNGKINCEEVEEEMESRVGGEFYCSSYDHDYEYDDDDAAGALDSRLLHVLGVSIAVGMFLWG